MKNEKITISDIANALGISPVSISRALTGQPGVSEELKKKIIDKAQEMGYAKLRKNNQPNVLVLHQKPYMLDNSNLSLMLQQIEKTLQSADLDYNLEFVDESSQKMMAPPYKLSKGSKFDGVIFVGRFDPIYENFISQFIKNRIFLTGYSPAIEGDIVRFNFNSAGYKQCEYLIKKGHTNIGFFGDYKLFRNKERILGIMAALEDNMIQVNQTYFLNTHEQYHTDLIEILSNGHPGERNEHLTRLSSHPKGTCPNFHTKLTELIMKKSLPSAIICDYDFTSVELIKTFHEHNIKVPEDISIIGCGNTEMSSLSIPGLTTLELNIEYACKIVVDTLLKRISQPDRPYQTTSILCRMVERDSVKAQDNCSQQGRG